MKTVEEVKIELTLMRLAGAGRLEISEYEEIGDCPVDDELRTLVCDLGPEWALEYAIFVDKGPHDETRREACKETMTAYHYALQVDFGPNDETWEGVIGDSQLSYLYALNVVRKPGDIYRTRCCKYDPLRYAREIDKAPHDETRTAACSCGASLAFEYARFVDEGAHDETRNACCDSPQYAYYYALSIDRVPTKETRKAAYEESKYKALFIQSFGG